jgi:serine/threonine-protein kinase HipA
MKKISGPKKIEVYAHWSHFMKPTLMGVLSCAPLRGKEIFSFEYDKRWLDLNITQVIDPDLNLFAGRQFLNDEKKSNFGLFLDSSPDRWGRLLMRRREAAMAKAESRDELTLLESDYLLGVFDGHRMGGIRFKLNGGKNFLNDNKKLATPHWTSLRELEHASFQLERDDAINDPDYLKWLEMLIAPGSSLGGARPKASVLDENEILWIAKFPSLNDNRDMGAWEMVLNELGRSAGLDMAEGQAKKINNKFHTYLSKRFDRNHDGSRLHFASAMTLLGYTDGKDHSDGVSYLEIVEFLMKHGARVDQDLEELWRRIIFSISVSNSDDHLRNHGFILTHGGWILSPAYDLNPSELATGLKLNISENDNSLDINLAFSVREYFRLSDARAREIISEVISAVKKWREVAAKYGISASDQDLMRKAFRMSTEL